MAGYYVVEVLNSETDEIVKIINAGESRSRAARIRDGLKINLNKDTHYVKIRFVEDNASKLSDDDDAGEY